MKKTKIKSVISWTIAVILAVAGLVIAVVPFIFMILNSFKDKFEMLTEGIFALPKEWSFANYQTVLEANFPRYFLNSVIVLVISLTLLLGILFGTFSSIYVASPVLRAFGTVDLYCLAQKKNDDYERPGEHGIV